MSKDGVLDVIFLIYYNAIWGLHDAWIMIGELGNLLGGQREVFIKPCKEVFEDVDNGVVTHE